MGQPETAQEVKQLVEAEMKSFKPRDYLAALPLPEFKIVDGDTAIAAELARVASQEPMKTLDSTRYQLEPPSAGKSQDLNAWRQATENAQAQLEHGELRLSNLELMSRFGPKAWANHVADIQAFERTISDEVADLRNERDGINKKRKLDQVSTGNDLRNLSRESEQYLDENGTTELALKELEVEVQRLQENCHERGVLPERLLSPRRRLAVHRHPVCAAGDRTGGETVGGGEDDGVPDSADRRGDARLSAKRTPLPPTSTRALQGLATA